MTTKLCKDCVHFQQSTIKPDEVRFHVCTRPVGISPVTGQPMLHQWEYCFIQRKHGGLFQYLENLCGKRGRFFQPK